MYVYMHVTLRFSVHQYSHMAWKHIYRLVMLAHLMILRVYREA